jgi:hypothetical protein
MVNRVIFGKNIRSIIKIFLIFSDGNLFYFSLFNSWLMLSNESL